MLVMIKRAKCSFFKTCEFFVQKFVFVNRKNRTSSKKGNIRGRIWGCKGGVWYGAHLGVGVQGPFL